MNRIIILFLGLTLAQSCMPYVRIRSLNTEATPLPIDANVVIFNIQETIPEGVEYIGILEVGDTWFSISNFDNYVKRAKKSAREQGANIIKLEKVRKERFSGLHTITTKIYNSPNLPFNIGTREADLKLEYISKKIIKEKRDTTANTNYARTQKGQLDLIFSLPHLNAYSLKPFGFER